LVNALSVARKLEGEALRHLTHLPEGDKKRARWEQLRARITGVLRSNDQPGSPLESIDRSARHGNVQGVPLPPTLGGLFER
jgi:hypothetical protein